MAIDPKLLEKARRSPRALTYDEAVALGRQLGFAKVRQVRGHRVLRHPVLGPLNLQHARDGHAKAYQVRRMLEAAKALPRA